ncbi:MULTISPECIES: DUF427 domain-containing protein [Rhodomicrobium]|uniref:DUF427 domain-containing protein n=1 Tax=Rhodomicrobium TaxID=1068 RepID=UPI001FD9B132|nr:MULTISPECIES: DUF427 domain-containing protein [Rhodomicrobium]
MAQTMPNSGPGYAKRPDHRVDLEPGPHHVQVIFNGEVIADSMAAVTVNESTYPPVHYVPLADVRQDVLRASDHTSYCPFKGRANYWSLDVGGKRAENAVWAYNEPYDEVAELKGKVAFYPSQVDQILID